MKSRVILKNNSKIHFIGIGGANMSALATYCKNVGMVVSGSDILDGQTVKNLQNDGITVFIGHDRKNAHGADIIVYNSAISEDNPEYQFALDHQKPLLKRSELLSLIEKKHNFSIAVSGCHGKTTATSMLAHIFIKANKHPTCFIGGEDKTFGNFVMGDGVFITEACEFKKNFLTLSPDIAVVLNIDNDHLDCYGNMEQLKKAYKKFCSNKISVINADDKNAVSISGACSITYGITEPATFRAKNIVEEKGLKFSLYVNGVYKSIIRLKVSGKHNVYNALAAIACAMEYGISLGIIKRALSSFTGVYRRQEILGEINGCIIEADYAHHPKEIQSVANQDDLVVFQPHTYSRTKILISDFTLALKNNQTIILPTYPAREEYDVEGSGYALYQSLQSVGADSTYADNNEMLFKTLDSKTKHYKRILFLGAGDIYFIAKKYAKKPQ